MHVPVRRGNSIRSKHDSYSSVCFLCTLWCEQTPSRKVTEMKVFQCVNIARTEYSHNGNTCDICKVSFALLRFAFLCSVVLCHDKKWWERSAFSCWKQHHVIKKEFMPAAPSRTNRAPFVRVLVCFAAPNIELHSTSHNSITGNFVLFFARFLYFASNCNVFLNYLVT